MKPTNVPPKSDFAHLGTVRSVIRMPSFGLSVRLGAILILAGLLVSSFYSASSASSAKKAPINQNPAVVQEGIRTPSALAGPGTSPSLRVGNYFPLLPVPQAGVSVTIYASDCSTPKTVFNLQDADKTVCAIVTGAPSTWRIIWQNSNFVAVQNVPVGSGTSTFTLTSTSSLGDWRVILFEPLGGTVQAVTSFTVIDAENPVADVSISKGVFSSSVSAGAQVIFALQVTNAGPSDTTAVQLVDSVPANTTFVSFSQLDGTVFNCSNPASGDTGTTVCTTASLSRGDTAIFLATYLVDSGVSAGDSISNTATVSSTVSDSNTANNSSTASVPVTSAPCVLTCPSNITQPADSGQAGAVVTYSTPTTSGDCGQPTTGEGGEIIPAISSSPASGSFFPVGTTTVITISQTGAVCTFQVTVENPGSLSISLNGANPFALECGTDFADPGATAVNGIGDPVSVAVSGTVDNHTPGSYTLTYTATEGPNSVSTTRTVNVSDNEAPVITLDGPNPMTVSAGQTFVDPGASANDACEGARPVNSSGTVDSNTPGTYTITYTASDSQNHTATATRSVIVESGGTAPPTITMNGDSQMTIECGATFTDPGATATASGGGSVPVTTSGAVDSQTPGTYTITYIACIEDSPGHCDPNRTSQAERTVTVEDTAAPTIEVHGDNPMTVECHTSFTDPGATAHDACAGDFAATAVSTVDGNTVGQYTVTYSATDPSGHAAAPVTRTVNVVDTTAPIVTAPPDVTVNTGTGAGSCSTTVTDATLGSGSANDACQGALSVTRTGVPAGNVFPVGQTTVTYSATDAYNHTASATQTVMVVDNTPPTISCPANITVYLPVNSTATSMVVNYTAPVGTDNCAGATTARTGGLASGAVFPVGTTTNTFRVTDAAGNHTDCSFTVTVLYNFTGFFSPVNNPPTLNSVNAGRAIPVKFSLSGDKGLNIFAPDNPYSVSLNCATNDPGVDVVETVTAGGSSLSFGGGQYIYVWKTESSWAGTCRQLVVTLNDGTVYTANFKFK